MEEKEMKIEMLKPLACWAFQNRFPKMNLCKKLREKKYKNINIKFVYNTISSIEYFNMIYTIVRTANFQKPSATQPTEWQYKRIGWAF